MSSSVKVKKSFFGQVVVSYDCPACGEHLQSKRDAVGTPSRCSSCDAKLWVPGVIEAEEFDREHAKTNAARRRKWQGFRPALRIAFNLILVVLSILAFRLLILAFGLLVRYTGEPPSSTPWIQTMGAIALGICGLAFASLLFFVVMQLKWANWPTAIVGSFLTVLFMGMFLLYVVESVSRESQRKEMSYEQLSDEKKWELLQEGREEQLKEWEKAFKKADVKYNEDAIKDYWEKRKGK